MPISDYLRQAATGPAHDKMMSEYNRVKDACKVLGQQVQTLYSRPQDRQAAKAAKTSARELVATATALAEQLADMEKRLRM